MGDDVRIEILDEKDKEANLTEILPRRNELFRPAVANVDQAMVIFAMESPKPNQNLLDRFPVSYTHLKDPQDEACAEGNPSHGCLPDEVYGRRPGFGRRQ